MVVTKLFENLARPLDIERTKTRVSMLLRATHDESPAKSATESRVAPWCVSRIHTYRTACRAGRGVCSGGAASPGPGAGERESAVGLLFEQLEAVERRLPALLR